MISTKLTMKLCKYISSKKKLCVYLFANRTI
uniref:Uncharacterized protein n=1 Tax=Arundo donax TaxID=35708 RepID=A0A0A9H8L8_ARUDO